VFATETANLFLASPLRPFCVPHFAVPLVHVANYGLRIGERIWRDRREFPKESFRSTVYQGPSFRNCGNCTRQLTDGDVPMKVKGRLP
jgi:hypothetical protein